ncbi:hypothetical protein HanXRQr2_Chr15g0722751 [Helianthus annuus]|uniref:Uncharacterized protein n=1 Tax=Helianthus annuus TaxID=4232 RepID=A0A9K3E6P3_HELAN|nr:hypothetical protein HanXRQr2_Chr15g0722751 [Helianthus annuus]
MKLLRFLLSSWNWLVMWAAMFDLRELFMRESFFGDENHYTQFAKSLVTYTITVVAGLGWVGVWAGLAYLVCWLWVGLILGWFGDIRGGWVDKPDSFSRSHLVVCFYLFVWSVGVVSIPLPFLYHRLLVGGHKRCWLLVFMSGIFLNQGVIRQDWLGGLSFRCSPPCTHTPMPETVIGSRSLVVVFNPVFRWDWAVGWDNCWGFNYSSNWWLECLLVLSNMMYRTLGRWIFHLLRTYKSWKHHRWGVNINWQRCRSDSLQTAALGSRGTMGTLVNLGGDKIIFSMLLDLDFCIMYLKSVKSWLHEIRLHWRTTSMYTQLFWPRGSFVIKGWVKLFTLLCKLGWKFHLWDFVQLVKKYGSSRSQQRQQKCAGKMWACYWTCIFWVGITVCWKLYEVCFKHWQPNTCYCLQKMMMKPDLLLDCPRGIYVFSGWDRSNPGLLCAWWVLSRLCYTLRGCHKGLGQPISLPSLLFSHQGWFVNIKCSFYRQWRISLLLLPKYSRNQSMQKWLCGDEKIYAPNWCWLFNRMSMLLSDLDRDIMFAYPRVWCNQVLHKTVADVLWLCLSWIAQEFSAFGLRVSPLWWCFVDWFRVRLLSLGPGEKAASFMGRSIKCRRHDLICGLAVMFGKALICWTKLYYWTSKLGHVLLGCHRMKTKQQLGYRNYSLHRYYFLYSLICYMGTIVLFCNGSVFPCRSRFVFIPSLGSTVSYFWSPKVVLGDMTGGMPPIKV